MHTAKKHDSQSTNPLGIHLQADVPTQEEPVRKVAKQTLRTRESVPNNDATRNTKQARPSNVKQLELPANNNNKRSKRQAASSISARTAGVKRATLGPQRAYMTTTRHQARAPCDGGRGGAPCCTARQHGASRDRKSGAQNERGEKMFTAAGCGAWKSLQRICYTNGSLGRKPALSQLRCCVPKDRIANGLRCCVPGR